VVTTPRERRKRVAADQGPALRLRLGYERLGRAAFRSHLDMVRTLPRVFRRARLPLYYSEGFKPKPVMTFGPSLPVGTASLVEYLDLKLRADLATDLSDLTARLSEVTLDGVRFFFARVLGPNDPALSKVIDEVEYVAGIPRAALGALAVEGPDELGALVAARRGGDLRVRRVFDNAPHKNKTIDVARFLLEVAVDDELGAQALARAGVLGELVPLRLRLAIEAAGTARAKEALEALTGQPDLPCALVRSGVWGSPRGTRAEPRTLEAFRKPTPATVATDASAPTTLT
jgi:radical SAM-linked protein